MAISIGYGSDRRGNTKKGIYGTRSSGKLMLNGGFNGAPTIDFTNLTDEAWYSAFPNSYRPSWDKDEKIKSDELQQKS